MVCFDTPTSRATSSTARPASTCFKAAIISASLCLLRDMLIPLSFDEIIINFVLNQGSRSKPPKSVLLLADFAGAYLDQNAVWTMKESAVFDKPHINKTAWVGAEKFPEELKNELTKFARREFPSFKSREEALEWLVS